MAWTIRLTSKVSLCASETEALDPGPETCVTGEMREKMKQAVVIARSMALVARQAVTRHRDLPEVFETLNKYFNLGSDDPNHARVCSRIADVYTRVLSGMDGGYRIRAFASEAVYLGKSLTGTRAFVPGQLAKGGEALGRFFQAADDGGHLDWDRMQEFAYAGSSVAPEKREIHLSLSVIRDDPPEDIARTLVHESTHKWANTDDVCYKHSTVAKQMSSDGETLQALVRQGFSYGAALEPKEHKARVTFVKYRKDGKGPMSIPAYPKNKFVASKEAWINNADSYAWTARRLWKKCETIFRIG
ncbi:hypothetical protein [Rubrimonas cliftonensis]|uniref:Lysine-specific metallo-endopeptidase n=1 Tax=Rubrimonas cliftonensis TaxID=89524 RepID=A0A1H4DN08_9RHOB|nr:hypothetical protein [Rubrimonas cliftonensis]SEA74173.1 hypothetical protein SAMN05444370_110141 [Rubrimonas cliftonensis]